MSIKNLKDEIKLWRILASFLGFAGIVTFVIEIPGTRQELIATHLEIEQFKDKFRIETDKEERIDLMHKVIIPSCFIGQTTKPDVHR